MKKIIISSSCALALLAGSGFAALAYAESNATATKTMDALRQERQAAEAQYRAEASSTRAQIQDERQMFNQNEQQRRQTLESQRKAIRKDATTTEAMKALREQFQATAEQARQAMKDDRDAFQQKVKSEMEVLKAKREQEQAQLKSDLEKIKDARKQQTVMNLEQRFNDINQKTTAQWTDALTRMNDLLVKISSRSDKAALAGKDVATTTAAIAAAKTAITAAQAAVTLQVAKTYPITVASTTDPTALKSAVAQTRNKLNDDLKAVRDLVQAAKQAVAKAAASLSDIPRVDDEESTATTTNQ